MASTGAEEVDVHAARANKLHLVERLADDLAHEIKNPLHSMVINLEVLRRRISRLPEESQGDLLRYAGVLGSELDRVTRRVELLFRLVRPERAGELTTFPQVVQELLDLLELERERHELSIDFQPEPQTLRGHLPREVARQVALNVLFEALNTAPRGGTLTIRTEVSEGQSFLRVRAAPAAAPHGEPPRLAVARSLVHDLNGTLVVDEEEAPSGDALCFSVSVPTAG